MLDKGGNTPELAELALEELTLDTELELDELEEVELTTELVELETELDELVGSAGIGVSSCLLQPEDKAATTINEDIDNNVLMRCKLVLLHSSPMR